MLDGSRVPVVVGGYWQEPVASYYRQTCQFGLYQAVHRIRPHLTKPDDERHIFIFTKMPVKDAVVDELLRDPSRVAQEQRVAAELKL